jgi:hypothetical protein
MSGALIVPPHGCSHAQVCWGDSATGGCPDSDIMSAIDDVIMDGADVISMSLGSPAASLDVIDIVLPNAGELPHSLERVRQHAHWTPAWLACIELEAWGFSACGTVATLQQGVSAVQEGLSVFNLIECWSGPSVAHVARVLVDHFIQQAATSQPQMQSWFKLASTQ